MMPTGSEPLLRGREGWATFTRDAIAASLFASARICIEPAIWSRGSSTRSSTVAGSQRATISSRPTTSRSFSLRLSGYGCALMSPRPSVLRFRSSQTGLRHNDANFGIGTLGRLVLHRLLCALDHGRGRGKDLFSERLQFLARDRVDDHPDPLRLRQQLLVAHRAHDRLAQRRYPLRRHAGRHHVGAAEGLGAVDQFHHPAILRRGGEVDRERHAHLTDVRMALVVLLDEHADEAGFEPVRTLRLKARPAEAA